MFDVLNAKNLAIRTPDTSAQRVWEFIGSTVLTSKSLLTHPEGNFQNISPSFLPRYFYLFGIFQSKAYFKIHRSQKFEFLGASCYK